MAAQTTTQTSTKPQNKNTPFSPINLYHNIYCKNCQPQCDIDSPKRHYCILSKIALELEQTRTLLQQRTQHPQLWKMSLPLKMCERSLILPLFAENSSETPYSLR